MKTNILTLIMTMVVGIILTGALLAPVVSNAQDPQTTFDNTNDSLVKMDVIETASEEVVVTFDHETGEIKTNGTTVPTSSGSGTYRPIITNNLYLYLRLGASPIGGIYQFDGSATVNAFYSGLSGDMTVTISGNTITFDYAVGGEAQNYSTTFEYVCYPSNNGEYVSKDVSQPFYISEENDLYYASLENNTAMVFGHGTTATMNGADVTATITSTTIEGVESIEKITGISVPILGTDTPLTGVVVCKATVSGHNTSMDNVSMILGAIPLMVLVSLVILAVSAIAYKRSD